MNDATRIETIEIKLAHLERSLQELGETVLSQHPALSETAVRVALAELQTLKTPLEGASYRAVLEKG